jgi:hypothetical protein
VAGWLSPKTSTQPSPPNPPPVVPAPPVVSDGMVFVGETVADNTIIAASAPFAKSWTLRNTGSTTWDSSYCLRPASGDTLGATAVCVNGNVAPNATHVFTANMAAPAIRANDSTYKQSWALSRAGGSPIGPQVWAQIKVNGQAKPVQPPAPPTAPAPQPPIAPPHPVVVVPFQITAITVPQAAKHLEKMSVQVGANQAVRSAIFEFTDGKGFNANDKDASHALGCNASSCSATLPTLNTAYASGNRPWRITVVGANGASTNRTGVVSVTK